MGSIGKAHLPGLRGCEGFSTSVGARAARFAKWSDEFKTDVRGFLEEFPVSFVGGIMNVPAHDIEATFGHCASGIYFNVFRHEVASAEVASDNKRNSMQMHPDSAVAERWGLREDELDNHVLYPPFIVTIGKFKDS